MEHEAPAIAVAHQVSKSYPGVQALKAVDFEVRAGEVRALLGANGAGKSTLIRMLSGVETPDDGWVEVGGERLTGGVKEAGRLGVGTVYQELSVIPEMTVAENLYLGHWLRGRVGIDTRTQEESAARVLREIGVDIDPGREVAGLTLAEQQIVEIARALHSDPRLLILDEPTSALASHEVDLVLQVVRRVAARGVGVIFVSHRMDEIRQIADSVTVMRDGRHVATTEVAGASTQRIVELMLGEPESAQAAYRRRPFGEVRLRVDDLAVPPKLSGVSFEVRAGEIVGLAGLLGAGRTELLQTIAGFRAASSGRIEINGRVLRRPDALAVKRLGVGLTPEDRKGQGVINELSIAENMVMSDYSKVSSAGTLRPGRINAAASALRDRLGIKIADLDHSIATLSGGNQQKTVIGRWLHAGSSVLLLDEPTRGVATLAMMMVCWGTALVLAGGRTVSLRAVEGYDLIALGQVIPGVPNGVVILVLLAIIAGVVMNKTAIGRYALAIGSNKEATRISGINTPRWEVLAYVICGIFTGISGILMSSRLSAAQPTLGQGYEMYAIAAAVIGGTSLRGGRASIFGAVIGAVTIQTIFNGLTVMGVQDQWQKVVLGVVVLLAVFVDIMRRGGKEE